MSGEAHRPQRQIRLRLALRHALDGDEPAAGAGGDKTAADEQTGDGDTEGNDGGDHEGHEQSSHGQVLTGRTAYRTGALPRNRPRSDRRQNVAPWLPATAPTMVTTLIASRNQCNKTMIRNVDSGRDRLRSNIHRCRNSGSRTNSMMERSTTPRPSRASTSAQHGEIGPKESRDHVM